MSKKNHEFSGILNIKKGPVLASGSRYRAGLLERLGLPFDTVSPKIDESPLKSEKPQALVSRLARQKALTVAQEFPNRVVIGSDQIAVFGDRIIGKPGAKDAAIRQLSAFSGNQVTFLTAVMVCAAAGRSRWLHTDYSIVSFRDLTKEEITRYVTYEEPYDCAGGFKCEGLGISLFDAIDNRDPTALIGLPMIFVSKALRHYGMNCP